MIAINIWMKWNMGVDDGVIEKSMQMIMINCVMKIKP